MLSIYTSFTFEEGCKRGVGMGLGENYVYNWSLLYKGV